MRVPRWIMLLSKGLGVPDGAAKEWEDVREASPSCPQSLIPVPRHTLPTSDPQHLRSSVHLSLGQSSPFPFSGLAVSLECVSVSPAILQPLPSLPIGDFAGTV